jgi:uncharacterized protein YjhX (UPF0386 family)
MHNDPLYLNWEFWTALVAAAALFLSQIPPIYQLVQRAKLRMEVIPRAWISHYVGNPSINLSIVLSNTGGRDVKVRRILLSLQRDGVPLLTLPAQAYSPEGDPAKQLLFAGLKIRPGEDRSHGVVFYPDYTRETERKIKDCTMALMKDLNDKRAASFNKDPYAIEADPIHVKPLEDILASEFIWKAGEYGLVIRAESSDTSTFVEKHYRFMLFESDSQQLRDYSKGYKHGEGITFGMERQGLSIRISEG